MKRTVRNNINPTYSLHNMKVIAFEATDNNIVMQTQSGILKTSSPVIQLDGYVEFHNVQWDFSYAYVLNFSGNVGPFTGEKLFLKDFITKFIPLGFTILDETYGYNTTKYSGYLTCNRHLYECMIEISHEGDMIFVTEE